MPFYEYQCQACGAQTEVLQKISDAPLRKCPDCGKSKLVKLVSAPVFRLKGGGWYETDFKGEGDRKRNLAGEAEPASTSDSESKAKPPTVEPAAKEPKPEAKPVKASAGKNKAAPAKRASKTAKSKARK